MLVVDRAWSVALLSLVLGCTADTVVAETETGTGTETGADSEPSIDCEELPTNVFDPVASVLDPVEDTIWPRNFEVMPGGDIVWRELSSIYRMSPGGEPVAWVELEPGSALRPVATTGSGGLFLIADSARLLVELDAEGTELRRTALDPIGSPTLAAFTRSSSGPIYVFARGDDSGDSLGGLGSVGVGLDANFEEQFRFDPEDGYDDYHYVLDAIAADEGQVYVIGTSVALPGSEAPSNYRWRNVVEARSTSGEELWHTPFIVEPATNLINNRLAIAGEYLYVSTTVGYNAIFQLDRETGELLGELPPVPDGVDLYRDVVGTPCGQLYVAGRVANVGLHDLAVWITDPEGVPLGSVATHEGVYGDFTYLGERGDLAFSPTGDLVIRGVVPWPGEADDEASRGWFVWY